MCREQSSGQKYKGGLCSASHLKQYIQTSEIPSAPTEVQRGKTEGTGEWQACVRAKEDVIEPPAEQYSI